MEWLRRLIRKLRFERFAVTGIQIITWYGANKQTTCSASVVFLEGEFGTRRVEMTSEDPRIYNPKNHTYYVQGVAPWLAGAWDKPPIVTGEKLQKKPSHRGFRPKVIDGGKD